MCRALGIWAVASVLSVQTAACGRSAGEVTAPVIRVDPPAPEASVSTPPTRANQEAAFTITEASELTTPSPITFRVRPLAGPGSMGPSEISPESDAAIAHVVAYMRANPTAPVRIECAVNAFKTSSSPNAARGASLAQLVTRALAARGVSCERLEAVGRVDRSPDGPAERVRVLVRPTAEEPEARAEACPRP